MKPDWDRLGSEYEGSSVLIGDADCTVHKDVCSSQGVSGYPTIKYYTSETDDQGEKYQGGRDYDSLQAFVEENLAGGCDITDEDTCSEREIKYLNKMRGKGDEKAAAELVRLTNMQGNKMKKELKEWLNQRINILEQM